MLVHLPSKRLVLNLQNPARVTTVIPSARTFDYKGSTLTAVPHKIDEVRVLRNLGIQAPSPILHHYGWPSGDRRDPFYAQRMTAQFLTLNPKAFVLNDMGTGKTLAALWAYDYLRSIGAAGKALVLAPLSTLERAWGDEIFSHFPHLNFCVMHGDKAKRLKLLADDSYDVYIINHHGIRVIEKELIERGFDTLVVDEGAIFRNASTALWKSLYKIAQTFERIWWLTGTPTPNAPTDAWAQCRIVSPERVPRYFGKFRDMVMRQFGPFRWVARDGATEIVREAMQPAVRFTRDQCIDLPPCIYQTREVPLTPEQKAAYKDMMAKLHMEFAGDQVQAINEAAKVSKLLQIVCGVVYSGNGEEVVLPTKPRIDEVIDTIEQAAAQSIVFVPFKSVLRYVAEQLAEHFDPGAVVREKVAGRDSWVIGPVGMISGDTPAGERARIFKMFQAGQVTKLVAQPAAMSHGLTLTAANTIIWYAPVNSNETYEQANARVTRPGQKHTQFVVHIEGSEIERRAYKRLQGRQKMQGLLLEAVQAGGY